MRIGARSAPLGTSCIAMRPAEFIAAKIVRTSFAAFIATFDAFEAPEAEGRKESALEDRHSAVEAEGVEERKELALEGGCGKQR